MEDDEAFGDDIILCVPGPWPDREAFLGAIIDHSDGRFVAAGGILLDTETKNAVGFQFEEGFNEDLPESFELASQGKISAETHKKITVHKSVAYLLLNYYGPDGHDGIRLISKAVQDSGGFAIKVETSGVAHEFDRWLDAVATDIPAVWYEHFVCHVATSETASFLQSVGMHQFALPDASIEGHDSLEEASQTLMIFNVYQLYEQPELADGQTFSIAEDAPVWRLSHCDDARYDDQDLFHNVEGIWQLKRDAEGAA